MDWKYKIYSKSSLSYLTWLVVLWLEERISYVELGLGLALLSVVCLSVCVSVCLSVCVSPGSEM